MGNKQRLVNNTMLLSLCTLINKGLLFVMLPFFTRWLTLDDYGTYDVYSTYITLLIPVITLATSNAVFRLSLDDEFKRNSYITGGLFIVLFNSAIVVVLLCLFGLATGWQYCIPFSFLLVSYVMDNYFQGYLRALKRIELYAFIKTLGMAIIAIASTVLIKAFSMGLLGLMLGYAIGFFVGDLIIILYTRYWIYFRPSAVSRSTIKELIAYSWPLIPNDISWWVINVSDRSIISYFLGTSANAIYAIAYKVPNLCTSIFGVFNISWQECASESVNDEDRNQLFQSVYNNLLSIIISLCICILAATFIIFDLLLDSRYFTGRRYTSILVVSVVFYVASLFFGGIQISLKNPKINGLSTVVGAVVNIITHLALVKYLGLYAAAISTLLSNMVVCFIRIIKNKIIKLYVIKEVKILFLILVYYAIVSTLELPIAFNVVNLLMAVAIFFAFNRSFILKYFKRIKR